MRDQAGCIAGLATFVSWYTVGSENCWKKEERIDYGSANGNTCLARVPVRTGLLRFYLGFSFNMPILG